MNRKTYHWVFIVSTIGLAFILRLFLFPFVSDDMTRFLYPWFAYLQNHAGLSAFAAPFSNYPPLYLYALKLLALLPMPALVSIKLLSFLGDIALASGFYIILKLKKDNPLLPYAGFAAGLFLPTVVINSALW